MRDAVALYGDSDAISWISGRIYARLPQPRKKGARTVRDPHHPEYNVLR